ncbi:hypothetical protein L195_g018833 [Trifolium pratense]|uniref:Reverse transcriptase zinc-binding domain-containing protein n=1 Tax=Trifolium pratense TaxID=57577 RepID=A0A2K3MXW4_TRIPR|nr:hypothetical protein L195_g018833 [Trifolium pratense]
MSCTALKLLPVNLNSHVEDCYTWKWNLNGFYTARDGYHWLDCNEFITNTNEVSWNWLWHISAPEKIKFFLWTTLQNAFPTKSMLSHRGMLRDIFCPRCNTDEATTMHCLRDYEFVKCLWKSFGFTNQTFFQENNLYSWLRHSIDGPSIFAFLAADWWLWRARNQMCMENKVMSYFTLRIMLTGGTCMILNVDGSSTSNPGVSDFKGLIQTQMVRGYKVLLDLLAKDWRVKVVHTFRENNTCADYLAKLGARNPEVYSPIAIPPNETSLILLADASETLFSR